MLTQQQYESLNNKVDCLEEQVTNLIAENRRLQQHIATFTDKEVRGEIADTPPIIDEDDGWE